ncbi:antibiotic biosynthesis monooxygenase domain-containing protein [mine drainage metagenome]|uniref:Antibiotic biosynthesis monooxygenase domain-containing protein n=1 Tax=mine drainage metagenome TaxID=410659 RepID=T1A4Z3_9ZZZZ
MIARVWRGITHKDTAEAYLKFLNSVALPALAGKPGQRGGWVLRRYQGEHAEFVMLTLWDSMDAISAWVGGDPQQAVYTAEEAQYLLDQEGLVRHYETVGTVTPEATQDT